MSTQIENVADLMASTLRELGRMKFQQVAQEHQNYEVFPSWFKKDKVMFQDGVGIQRNVMVNLPEAARHVSWTDTDNPDISDLMTQMQVPWRHANTNWSYKRQEALINRGASLVFNVIEPRRAGAMIDMIQILESAGWSAPSSSSDDRVPYGIPYWITTDSGTPAFDGGAASGHTTKGGVNPTTYPAFKNWTGQYTTASKADLIKKMRTAKRKCGFVSPVSVKDYRGSQGARYRVYCGESVFSSFEDVGESQNENLGRDIAMIDGVDLTFRKHPIRWVPYLDGVSTNPVYMIDHSTFYPVCLKGDYLHESKPVQDPLKHDWYTVHVDLTYNYLCVDPRRNAVFYV